MGRRRLFKSAEQLEGEILEYFQECIDTKKIPSKAGLRVYLRVTEDWLSRHRKTDLSEPIKEAYDYIESQWVNNLAGNNATGSIFYLKSAFHYKDRQDVDITTGGEKINYVVKFGRD